MSWSIKIGGTVIPANVERIEEELNGDEYAQFTIPNNQDNREFLISNQNVVIEFMGEDVYKGVMTGGKISENSIRCKVYNAVYYKASRKTHTGTYNNTDGATILNNIASDVGINVDSAPSGVDISVEYDHTYGLDAARYLAEVTDKDIWASGYSTISIGTRGTYRGKITNFATSDRSIDRYKRRTKVIVRGTDENGDRIYGVAGLTNSGSLQTIITGVAKENQMQDDVKVIIDKKSKTQSELNARAKYYLELYKPDTDSMQINVPINEGYYLKPGDTVKVVYNEFVLSGVYRIWKTVKTNDTVRLELDRPTNLVEKEILDMRNLEELGIYPITASQIAPDSITSEHIANGAVDTAQIAPGAVTTTKIDDYAITTPKLTANQIYGKDFRTAYNVGPTVNGVKFDSDGIEGWGGGILQFSLNATNGKATAGGGNVILDASGIKIVGQTFRIANSAGSPRMYLYEENGITYIFSYDQITMESNDDIIIDGDEILIEGGKLLLTPDAGTTHGANFVVTSPFILGVSGTLQIGGSVSVGGTSGKTTTLEFVKSGGGYITLTFSQGILTGWAST